MNLYSTELESFEIFCRKEFKTIFDGTGDSVTDVLALISSLPSSGFVEEPNQRPLALKNTQFESIQYSFFSGGKRFRPLLSFAVAEFLTLPIETIYPWAMAIEMIHTYSLIHDDLPSMDNDDLRRGVPANHKVFGDAIALLSGDALLTEAFAVLAKYYGQRDGSLGELVTALAKASGLNGMILGQYLDISLNNDAVKAMPSLTSLSRIHLLKTGALICGAFTGPALLKQMPASDLKVMREIGFLLGYAFQVKDDIIDSEQDKDSKKNLNQFFKDQNKLIQFLDDIHKSIETRISAIALNQKSESLTLFLKWNAIRDK